MAFIVEMARGKPDDPDFATYSCSAKVWEDLLAIARSYGWIPSGTVPYPWETSPERLAYFKPTYHPEEWAFCKWIEVQDARALSEALRRAAASIGGRNTAQPSAQALLKEELSAIESARVNSTASQLMLEFAEFAEAGGFAFAWDD